MKVVNEQENKKSEYYFNYEKAIIFLLIILIGLFIYDKHDEWKKEKELKKMTQEAVESIEKINNRQF